jgi:uncharacterized protein (DUF486 family)
MTIEGFLIQILKLFCYYGGVSSTESKAQVVVLTLKGTSFSEAVLSVPADGVINNPLIHCLLGPKILLVMLHYLIWKLQLI